VCARLDKNMAMRIKVVTKKNESNRWWHEKSLRHEKKTLPFLFLNQLGNLSHTQGFKFSGSHSIYPTSKQKMLLVKWICFDEIYKNTVSDCPWDLQFKKSKFSPLFSLHDQPIIFFNSGYYKDNPGKLRCSKTHKQVS
jgi:hypothetical protein